MALNIEDKKQIVTEVNAVAASALSAVVADYRGLTVAEMDLLRKNARACDVYLRVVRNTLARRALEGTDFECMREFLLGGPLVLAFSQAEPGAAARLVCDFVKKHNNFKVKLVSIGGRVLGSEQLEMIAKLPTHDEAIATLMLVMKAPIKKFVCTTAAPITKFVRTLAAIRDAKQ